MATNDLLTVAESTDALGPLGATDADSDLLAAFVTSITESIEHEIEARVVSRSVASFAADQTDATTFLLDSATPEHRFRRHSPSVEVWAGKYVTIGVTGDPDSVAGPRQVFHVEHSTDGIRVTIDGPPVTVAAATDSLRVGFPTVSATAGVPEHVKRAAAIALRELWAREAGNRSATYTPTGIEGGSGMVLPLASLHLLQRHASLGIG